MKQYGKKMDATFFLTLSGGGLEEPVYVCNSPQAVQRDDGHVFLPLQFDVYLDKRFDPCPGFNIPENEQLISRFNESVINATIEFTKNDIPYVIRTRGGRSGDDIHLRVQEAHPENLSDLY